MFPSFCLEMGMEQGFFSRNAIIVSFVIWVGYLMVIIKQIYVFYFIFPITLKAIYF